MRYVTLGKTGLKVSEVGFGGIPIIRLSMEEAIRVLMKAYDSGITFFDTANVYLDSEEKMGKAFKGLRDRLVIATKSIKRNAAGVEADIDLSLRQLQTDYIDLYQIHQLSLEGDYEAVMGPGGVLETLVKAQQAGKIRHIGVTSHSISMAVRLVKTGRFSTVQFPFNFIESDPVKELHPAAREQGMAILAMKPFAGGAVGDASVCFKFLRQYPDVIPLPGFDAVEQIDEVLGFYDSKNVVSGDDLALMDQYRNELGSQFCRRCEYCQPCEQGVMITAAMGYPVVVRRMSLSKGVGFMKKAMESVRNCIDCGECVGRCPYSLPIPETLQKHLAMYEEHSSQKG